MANVLPLTAQKRVWALYRARFLIALSLAISAVAILFALALIPSYLALSLASPPAQDPKFGHASPDDPVALARAQALLSSVVPLVAATTTPTDLIAAALNDRPKGAAIDHILFTAGTIGQTGQLVIGGKSTPQNIAAYRNALQKDPHFTTISLPVDALVGNESGDFSITLTGNF